MSIPHFSWMPAETMHATTPSTRTRFVMFAAAMLLLGLLGIAYRDLPTRMFVADDFEWLVAVRDTTPAQLVQAFDPSQQEHFYRPLVWLLFYSQWQLFGSDPTGYHGLSLTLHLLNAALLGLLAWRLIGRPEAALVAAGVLLLHPAPFEAVTWVAAQSELLAALLLLAAAHAWISPTFRNGVLAVLLLALALLAKESAVIGLCLMLLAGYGAGRPLMYGRSLAALLLTLGYLLIQAQVVMRNYLVQDDEYGLGAQILLNPLRSLGLVAAPLPGSGDGAAWWLIPVGVIVAFIVSLATWRSGLALRVGVAALLITLIPTAPFASPPDSRYFYLPVAMAALLLAGWIIHLHRPWQHMLVVGLVLAAALASVELRSREVQFAVDAGPGTSLWRLAQAECGAAQLNRML
ncbi:MAG TPA: hypothetical protein PKA05_18650, partial [Roseiflexaceae bacterium]|nr:hypothetical protein [Roseiflexaceae bacterium]